MTRISKPLGAEKGRNSPETSSGKLEAKSRAIRSGLQRNDTRKMSSGL